MSAQTDRDRKAPRCRHGHTGPHRYSVPVFEVGDDSEAWCSGPPTVEEKCDNCGQRHVILIPADATSARQALPDRETPPAAAPPPPPANDQELTPTATPHARRVAPARRPRPPAPEAAVPAGDRPRRTRRCNATLVDQRAIEHLDQLTQRLRDARDEKHLKGQLGLTLLLIMGLEVLSDLDDDDFFDLARQCATFS